MESLSEEQTHVVKTIVECGSRLDTHLFIIDSAPGSGKTTTATVLASEYIKRWSSHKVLLVTFNKATEMSIKEKLFGKKQSAPGSLCVSTINAAGLGILSAHMRCSVEFNDTHWAKSIDVPLVADLAKLKMGFIGIDMRSTMNELGIVDEDTVRSVGTLVEDTLTRMETAVLAKSCVLRGGDVLTGPSHLPFAAQVYLPVRLNLRSPVRYDLIIVDEFQDLQPTDAELCLLFNPTRLVLVGDRHQSIYQWRGAYKKTVENIIAPKFASVSSLRLSRSFRCPCAVAKCASSLAPQGVFVGKDSEPNAYVRHMSVDEWVAWVSCNQTSVCLMARTWSKLRHAMCALASMKVPFILEGVKYFKGCTRRVLTTAHEMTALMRRPRMIGPLHRSSAATELEQTDNGRRAVWHDLLTTAAKQFGRNADRCFAGAVTVRLCTVHQMKGREIDHAAYLCTGNDDSGIATTEDVNILYTAITRARVGFTYVSDIFYSKAILRSVSRTGFDSQSF